MLFYSAQSKKARGTRPFSFKITNRVALRSKAARDPNRSAAFQVSLCVERTSQRTPGKNQEKPTNRDSRDPKFCVFFLSNFGWVRFEAGAQRAHKNHRNPTFNLHQARLRAPDQPHRWWSWPSLSTCACRFLNAKAPPLPLPALLHILKAR